MLWDASSDRFDFSHTIHVNDGRKFISGGGSDFQFYHNGTDSVIDNLTGDFYLTNKADDKDIVFRSDDGSGGFTTYFRLDGSQSKTVFEKHTQLLDSQRAQFGNGGDMYLQHDGTDSHIVNTNGDLTLHNQADDKDIIFKCDDGSGGMADRWKRNFNSI